MHAFAARPTSLEDLAPLAHAELVRRFSVGVENFDVRVATLSERQVDTAFLESAGIGTWPVRVLLGHLADAEMLFVMRMRRVVGEDGPVFEVWDENSYIDRGMYAGSDRPQGEHAPVVTRPQPAGAFIATVHTLRRWTGEWLASLTDAAWTRTGMHPQRGPQTLRTILEYDVMHLERHAWFLNKKVEKFLGPAPAGSQAGPQVGPGGQR
jgi:hypothetical protein